MQALRHLCDDNFRITAEDSEAGEGVMLLRGMADALSLPPALKAKWLRADCLVALDLSTPVDDWSLSMWQELVMCFHAVPAMECLSVCLPRYTLESLRQAVLKPLAGRECNLCGSSGSLHFHCTSCRCARKPYLCLTVKACVEGTRVHANRVL